MQPTPDEVRGLVERIESRNKLTPFHYVVQRLGKGNELPEDVCNVLALTTATKGATRYGSREGLVEYLADRLVDEPDVPTGNKILANLKPYGRTKEDQLRLEWLLQREAAGDNDAEAGDDEEDLDD